MVLGWVTPWEVLVLHSFLRPERPKPLPSTSEAMVLGLGIRRDRYAVSLVGLGESFPEWGRNSDSEFVRESPDGFGARLPCPVRGRPRGHRRDPTMAIPRSFERFRGSGRRCAVRDVHKGEGRRTQNECDHTSTKAPDPIRTPKLSVLGRE